MFTHDIATADREKTDIARARTCDAVAPESVTSFSATLRPCAAASPSINAVRRRVDLVLMMCLDDLNIEIFV
jgi:hypothetical protein